MVGFLSQIYISSFARIAKQGSVLCLFLVLPHSLLFSECPSLPLFCTQKILFRYRLCFGRRSCVPNYADE